MMKPLDWQYELHVLGASKKTLSLDEFADLAKRLADLLGEQERVHFGALRDGSARILAKVEESARQNVVVQLAKLRHGDASAKVIKLNDYLGSKGWRGELKNAEGGMIIAFPGTSQKKPEQIQTVNQPDSLIGQVIKIGGRDDTVPMTIKTPDGSFVDVNVKGRDEARRLPCISVEDLPLPAWAVQVHIDEILSTPDIPIQSNAQQLKPAAKNQPSTSK